MRKTILKKAQIQMGETIAVLVIIVILIVLGLVFYFTFTGGDVEEERAKVEDLDSISKTIFVSRMVELRCSGAGEVSYACVDKYRAQAFHIVVQGDVEARALYRSLIGYANITLNMQYSEQENITIYSYEPGKISSASIARMPVLVSDPVTEKNHFAFLEVTVFSWEKPR